MPSRGNAIRAGGCRTSSGTASAAPGIETNSRRPHEKRSRRLSGGRTCRLVCDRAASRLCAAASRADGLGGQTEDKTDASVWAVTCFMTRAGFRRLGISCALARAAVDFARPGGAGALEGYPMITPARDRTSPRSPRQRRDHTACEIHAADRRHRPALRDEQHAAAQADRSREDAYLGGLPPALLRRPDEHRRRLARERLLQGAAELSRERAEFLLRPGQMSSKTAMCARDG